MQMKKLVELIHQIYLKYHQEHRLRHAVKKKIQITEYFSDQIDTSLPAILSRMTASDGIPFSLFCTSNDLRMLLISKGHKEVPKSPNTIRKLVFEYGQKICKQITQEMKNVSANGFSSTWKILIIRF